MLRLHRLLPRYNSSGHLPSDTGVATQLADLSAPSLQESLFGNAHSSASWELNLEMRSFTYLAMGI